MNHIPVLEKEIISQFDYLKYGDGYFVDGTLGMAGHSIAIAKNCQLSDTNCQTNFVGIDKDKEALRIAKENIEKNGFVDNFILIHDDFKNVNEAIKQAQNDGLIEQNPTINGALIDLGVSSMQFDDRSRGFSFSDLTAVLDMRMNQEQNINAKTILNNYPQAKLEKILLEYGEEKFFKFIAKNICKQRKEKPFRTIGDLLEVLEKSIPPKVRFTSKKHFATKTFQALRIEVNSELLGLDKAIDDFIEALAPQAKLAIITFHSLEDRIVKSKFKELENPCKCPKSFPTCVCGKKPLVKILTKKPISPSEEELLSNPRSRSAKLRVVEKL